MTLSVRSVTETPESIQPAEFAPLVRSLGSGHRGWMCLGVADDIPVGVHPVEYTARPLALVVEKDTVRLIDATCPHRGAHLGYGGKMCDGRIECPFHARRFTVGGSSPASSVQEHPCVVSDGLIFGKVNDGPPVGPDDAAWLPGHRYHEVAHRRRLRVACPVIIENAFDETHFTAVHEVPEVSAFTTEKLPDGTLEVRGTFHVVRHRITQEFLPSSFRAVAISPSVVCTTIGGPGSPVVMTCAAPVDSETCDVIVSVSSPIDSPAYGELLRNAHVAIDQDAPIWEHLTLTPPTRGKADAASAAYWEWAAQFAVARSVEVNHS